MKPHIVFRNGRWIAWPRRADHTAHHLARMLCDQLNWGIAQGKSEALK